MGRTNGTYAALAEIFHTIHRIQANRRTTRTWICPGYSPCLNVVKRFGRLLRRRVTHNRLFDTLADLRRSLRGSLSYFQTMRERVRTLLIRQTKKRRASAGS